MSVRQNVVIICCVVLHFFWAGLIFYDPAALGGTSISGPLAIFKTGTVLAVVLLAVGTLALLANTSPFPANAILLLPQQMVLQLSAASALAAMILGHYADGVQRPFAFIAADQVHSILLASGHALAIMSLGICRK